MAIIYQGVTTWRQDAPEKWDLSDFGLDSLQVTMSGAETERTDYQDTLTQWAASAIDGQMFLRDWSSTDERHYPRVDLHFIGRKDGALPVVRSGNGLSLQTVSTRATDHTVTPPVDYTADFQFYAITTKYDWIQATPPGDTPENFGVLSSLNPQANLLGYRITASDGSTGGIPLGTFTDLFNALSVSEVISDYQFETLVPGEYWSCTATSMRTLVGN